MVTKGLPGRVTTEDISDVCSKSRFFIDQPRHRDGAAAAVALTPIEPSLALAGSEPSRNGVSVATAPVGATDVSARRRYYRGGGGAAAAGAFAAIVGTGLAIAATQNRRDDYYYGGNGYYDGGPGYYGGGPVYYGGGPYYGGYGRSSVPHFNGHPLAGW